MRLLKLAIAATAILAVLGGIYQSASAEQGAAVTPGKGKSFCFKERHHKMGPGARLDRMTAFLGLTQEQRLQILPILDEQFKEKQAVFKDGSLTRDQRRAKMMELREKFHAKIAGILTPDQQKKFDEMKKSAMKHRGGQPCKAMPPNPS